MANLSNFTPLKPNKGLKRLTYLVATVGRVRGHYHDCKDVRRSNPFTASTLFIFLRLLRTLQ